MLTAISTAIANYYCLLQTQNCKLKMFRYRLQPYKTPASRYTCPQCGARRRFTRYIDTQTNQHLADHVGKCDRADKCGYHFTPKQYFAQNPYLKKTLIMKPIARTPKVSPTGGDLEGAYNTLPYHLVEQTLTHPEHNYFIYFLNEMFAEATVKRLIADYRIGTSKHWYGATVFWQIDVKDEVRTGKIMLYNVQTCKRIKYPYNHIAWAHKLVGKADICSQSKSEIEHPKSEFILKQCLFGEHLLAEYPDHTVALVESEKTAIIASGYLPEYLWLAAGSLEGLTLEKCRVLNGRNVMLFPDLGATAKWQDKANKLNAKLPGANFTVSQYLQSNVIPEFRYPGMDLGDFFIDDHLRCMELEREWGLRE